MEHEGYHVEVPHDNDSTANLRHLPVVPLTQVDPPTFTVIVCHVYSNVLQIHQQGNYSLDTHLNKFVACPQSKNVACCS